MNSGLFRHINNLGMSCFRNNRAIIEFRNLHGRKNDDIFHIFTLIHNVFFQAGNLNAEDDFESEYLRYGGTVGVRNPRLVAAMRGIPPYQQHIQMNMMNRF